MYNTCKTWFSFLTSFFIVFIWTHTSRLDLFVFFLLGFSCSNISEMSGKLSLPTKLPVWNFHLILASAQQAVRKLMFSGGKEEKKNLSVILFVRVNITRSGPEGSSKPAQQKCLKVVFQSTETILSPSLLAPCVLPVALWLIPFLLGVFVRELFSLSLRF